MSADNDGSRPHAKGGSRTIHCEVPRVPTGPDASPDLNAALAEKIQILSNLIRLQEEQDRAERLAYDRGWRKCGEAFAQLAADEYARGWGEGRAVGYYRATVEADERWTEVARQAHFLGSPESKTHAQLEALRNGADWAEVRDWPVTGGRGVAA